MAEKLEFDFVPDVQLKQEGPLTENDKAALKDTAEWVARNNVRSVSDTALIHEVTRSLEVELRRINQL